MDIKNNIEWVFGGIGVAAISGAFALIKWLFGRKGNNPPENTQSNTNNNNHSINITNNVNGGGQAGQSGDPSPSITPEKEEELKRLTNILFIDDDTKFKTVPILKRAGWVNTKSIKDVDSPQQNDVKRAHIIFVDIKGVGAKLDCKDEGLGLAMILKKEYPDKKIVIYSAEPDGDRFHEALRIADDQLSKNAEPYEFLHLVDQYSKEIFLNR